MLTSHLIKRGLGLQTIVPDETINYGDRDLPWITKNMKQPTEKNRICRNLAKPKCSGMGNNVSHFERFNTVQNKLNSLIAESKQKIYTKIATTLPTSQNVSWINPIFWQNNFITDFRQKPERFNSFLANQCLSINSNSKIATDSFLFTDKSLSNVPFADNNIVKITNGVNPNKAYGHDIISIHMTKIFGN